MEAMQPMLFDMVIGHQVPNRDPATVKLFMDLWDQKVPKKPEEKWWIGSKHTILALNSSGQQVAEADYNVLHNAPDNWLPIVAIVCERRSSSLGA